jgi:hypothetical protein
MIPLEESLSELFEIEEEIDFVVYKWHKAMGPSEFLSKAKLNIIRDFRTDQGLDFNDLREALDISFRIKKNMDDRWTCFCQCCLFLANEKKGGKAGDRD